MSNEKENYHETRNKFSGYKLGNINIPKEKDISVRIIKYNMGKAKMTNDEYFFYLKQCK